MRICNQIFYLTARNLDEIFLIYKKSDDLFFIVKQLYLKLLLLTTTVKRMCYDGI